MVKAVNTGDMDEANRLHAALKPLFGMVGVVSEESTPYGTTEVKARNPLPLKTLMNILGVPAGPCRQPLGKMNGAGLDIVLGIARKVQANNPEIFAPVASFFGVDIDQRLASVPDGLAY
jgi:4-hydroxy-tetrahydrodipicolinate synthase